MSQERLFKVLDVDGNETDGGSCAWSFPHEGLAGEWRSSPEAALFRHCFRLCREEDLIHRLGPEIYKAEGRGERMDGHNEIIVQEARLLCKLITWNEQTARLFACDCVEHVLPLFERHCPNDPRLRRTIAVARQYAEGTVMRRQLRVAGGQAWDVLWPVDFELFWHTQGGVEKAIHWLIERGAAWHAARKAARNVAEAASCATHGTAWFAARRASLCAAVAVGNATGIDPVCDSGWIAACKAERKWQTDCLIGYLYPT